jgi:uncharacterized protein YcbX
MAEAIGETRPTVVALWRYPVKSMMGEELNASDVTDRGLLGDRAYALIDADTGRVVSAKDPRKWPSMFAFRASYAEPPHDPGAPPPVWITLPDGGGLSTDQTDADARLSRALGRPVRLANSAPEGSTAEGYWPDFDFVEAPDKGFQFPLPPGTFFDGGAVHLVTTATLDRLRALEPDGRFEARRFRPNLVIEATGDFVENGWVGRTLAVGDEVRLRVTDPCPRCVMTTLPQGDLPKDPSILRAAVRHNAGNVGVYAAVVRGGHVRRGDAVTVE